jgi:pimeloyl-ACP methyl ester carboxylesterase
MGTTEGDSWPRRGMSDGSIAFDVGGDGPPVLFLHGLTFDRRTWRPITELAGDRITGLAVDLPGHGESPPASSYDLDVVAEAVHGAVLEAGLDAPIVVGHSISGLTAFAYAARYPAAAVVDVDMVLDLSSFVELVRPLAAQLFGPEFDATWAQFQDGMRLDLIPPPMDELVRSTIKAQRELVLGYWAPIFEETPGALSERVDAMLTAVDMPCLAVHGNPLTQDYRDWLAARVPQIDVVEWPDSGHFPHLVHLERFVDLLVELSGRVAHA